MSIEQNNDQVPGPPVQGDQPVQQVPQGGLYQDIGDGPPRRKSGWRVFFTVILVLSVLANIVLFLMVVGLAVFLGAGRGDALTEEVIRSGPRHTKIAVVRLEGVINNETADEVYKQLEKARKDERVKGIILRINSPGGTISGSDAIYHQIRDRTDKPVVAFMQGVAASGGYYSSVACDKIVAEPTAITGSIGVIGGWFVIRELLEEKLGIEPFIVKSGRRKDWPSAFHKPSEEEQAYVHKKLIGPAYARFVKIVAEGRKSVLDANSVKALADGSIYTAGEALEKKLIDDIGYLDDAIEQAKRLANIEQAQVVEYRRPFSLSSLLRSEAATRIDRDLLYELCAPQVLYLWTGP